MCGQLTQAVTTGGGENATIDLCSSDDEQSPRAPPPKRRSAPAAASTTVNPTTRQPAPPQRRPDTQQKGTAAKSGGASARAMQPDLPRCLGIPDSRRRSGRQTLGGAAGGSGASWMFGGEGAYVPDPRAAQVDMKLRLHEIVDVLDIGLARHPARAVLDSGARPCKGLFVRKSSNACVSIWACGCACHCPGINPKVSLEGAVCAIPPW